MTLQEVEAQLLQQSSPSPAPSYTPQRSIPTSNTPVQTYPQGFPGPPAPHQLPSNPPFPQLAQQTGLSRPHAPYTNWHTQSLPSGQLQHLSELCCMRSRPAALRIEAVMKPFVNLKIEEASRKASGRLRRGFT